MQLIHTTKLTANFSQISNSIIQSAMPPKPQKVLIYLLSKPKNWQLKLSDIKARLALSTYAVRQALRWLADAGYAAYERLKSGHTVWRVYDTPQPVTRVVEPRVENPRVEDQPDLTILDKQITLEQQPVVVPPSVFVEAVEPQEPVNKTIPYIEGLKHSQQNAANKLLSGLDQTAVTAILLVYSQAMKSGRVGNPIGYLTQLVRASKENCLTVPATSAPPERLEERVAKAKAEQKKACEGLKIDNNKWLDTLVRQYGKKIMQSI